MITYSILSIFVLISLIYARFHVKKLKSKLVKVSNQIIQLKQDLTRKAEFAKNIGERKFNIELTLLNDHDILGRALLEMRNNLISIAKEEEERNWVTKGFAQFSNILRSDDDIQTVFNTVISELVNYMEANQGSLFIIDEQDHKEKYMDMVSCYAWSKRKFHKGDKIYSGQGLIGQCWKEAETIHLTEIPEDYIKITSGLGKSNPTSILIVPIKLDERVCGIIEIASLNTLKAYQISFLEKLSENLAAMVLSFKSNQKTNNLLKDSQLKADQLSQKEDELKKNLEELKFAKTKIDHANQLLENEKKRTFAILEGAVDGVISVDSEAIVEYINKAGEEIFEITKQEIIGKNISKIIPIILPGSGVSGNIFLDEGNVKKIIDVRTEITYHNKFNDEKSMLLSASSVEIEGKHYYTFFVQNITVDLF